MPHYYDKNPRGKERLNKISYKKFQFVTASGVFGKKRFDTGSEILVDNAFVGRKVLDLGCGYGPVGIILAERNPDSSFLLADINSRAVALAKKNILLNNIRNAEARQSDGFEKIKEKFDTILLNPPQSAGKRVCEKLIYDSREHLFKKGTLQVVVRRNKGGKIIEGIMRKAFGNIDVLAKKSGYWVYISKNL